MLRSLPVLLLGVATSFAWEHGASLLMTAPAPSVARPAEPEVQTYSSFDRPDAKRDREKLPAGFLQLQQADVSQVLAIYQELSGRTVLRPEALPAVKITLRSQTPLSRREALQALDTALAENHIATVLMGTKFVQVVPEARALNEGGPVIELPASQLPESKSFMVRFVHLRYLNPKEAVPCAQPFSSLPNSIVAMPASGTVVLRDYSVNIRRMLEVLEKQDVKSALEEARPPAPLSRKKPR